MPPVAPFSPVGLAVLVPTGRVGSDTGIAGRGVGEDDPRRFVHGPSDAGAVLGGLRGDHLEEVLDVAGFLP